MNKKLLIPLITIFSSIIAPAYANAVNGEFKAAAVMFGKFAFGVVISSIIIGLGLIIYKKAKYSDYYSMNNSAENNRCVIDDTETIDEAIDTFLSVNNN